MKTSSKAKDILDQISDSDTKLGDLRQIAKQIRTDHKLAMELWSTGQYFARQLAILIMDKKLLSPELIDKLDKNISEHPYAERSQLMDWLMANQLSGNKKTIALMESWQDGSSALKRRIFWYFQARLRWVGQTPPPNTALTEKQIENEVPEVQWAMNYTAAQIGIFQPEHRARCIAIGERTGLYKDEVVAKNCTPNYLPDFIAMQVAELKK